MIIVTETFSFPSEYQLLVTLRDLLIFKVESLLAVRDMLCNRVEGVYSDNPHTAMSGSAWQVPCSGDMLKQQLVHRAGHCDGHSSISSRWGRLPRKENSNVE